MDDITQADVYSALKQRLDLDKDAWSLWSIANSLFGGDVDNARSVCDGLVVSRSDVESVKDKLGSPAYVFVDEDIIEEQVSEQEPEEESVISGEYESNVDESVESGKVEDSEYSVANRLNSKYVSRFNSVGVAVPLRIRGIVKRVEFMESSRPYLTCDVPDHKVVGCISQVDVKAYIGWYRRELELGGDPEKSVLSPIDRIMEGNYTHSKEVNGVDVCLLEAKNIRVSELEADLVDLNNENDKLRTEIVSLKKNKGKVECESEYSKKQRNVVGRLRLELKDARDANKSLSTAKDRGYAVFESKIKELESEIKELKAKPMDGLQEKYVKVCDKLKETERKLDTELVCNLKLVDEVEKLKSKEMSDLNYSRVNELESEISDLKKIIESGVEEDSKSTKININNVYIMK